MITQGAAKDASHRATSEPQSLQGKVVVSDGGEGEDRARLYVVYLGGDVISGRLGEDHEVVLLVARNADEARRCARAKWRGAGSAHVDAIAEVRQVDGHIVRLQPTSSDTDEIIVDPTYVP